MQVVGKIRDLRADVLGAIQPVVHLRRAPRHHVVPALDQAHARHEVHPQLEHPGGRAERAEHGARPPHPDHDVVPVLVLEHVKRLAERPVGHEVEAEPAEQIRQVHGLGRVARHILHYGVEHVEILEGLGPVIC